MKILILSALNNRINRGVESFSTKVFDYFTDQGTDVLLLPYSFPVTVNPPIFADAPFKYLSFVALDVASLSILIQALLNIPKIIKFNPDIYWPQNGFWQILVCRFCRLINGGSGKIVVNGHAGIGHDDLKSILAGPDCFIAQTPPALKWAQAKTKSRLEMIPSMVGLEFSREAEPLNLGLEKPIVLTSAALVPYKRVDNVIKAVNLLGRGSVLVAGDGPLKEELTKLGNDILGSGRFLLKKFVYSDMPSLYKTADVFVLASTEKESFGIVILEAMAAGLPVVVNDDPIRRWLVGESGVVSDCSQPEEIARGITKALTTILAKPNLDRFSWKNIFPEYTKLFSDLLTPGPGR